MAKANVKKSLNPRRVFSDKLKKIIKDIEQGKVNVLGVSREYAVSQQAVYSWLKKFSTYLHPSTTLVMQMDSEQYRSKELEKKVQELEATIGRKQMEIDFLNKLIEIAGKDIGIDLKKYEYICIGWFRQNKWQKEFNLNDLYHYLGVSKQSVQQMLKRHENNIDKGYQFIDKAEAIREDHPVMGCRKMSLTLTERGWGRDKIEGILLASGLRVIYPPNYTKTTHSLRIYQFRNLIEGRVVRNINEVVQTDITYLWMNNRFYYLVFIIDVYSRLIVGHQASCGLEAMANIKTLLRMIKLRGKDNIKGLIHHSDRGSQYHCKDYLKILKKHGIKVSMCNEAWENAYTERINQTIKNEYLRHRKIDSLPTLKELNRAIKLYNENRPHWSLLYQMAPAGYEKYVNNLSKGKRPKMRIYKESEELSTK